MNIHLIHTVTVTIHPSQRQRVPGGTGRGRIRILHTLTDRRLTDPLPIIAWVIEPPEGVIVVDTGETARPAEPGTFAAWNPSFKHLKISASAAQKIGPQLVTPGTQPMNLCRGC